MPTSSIVIGIVYVLALTTTVVPLSVGLEPKGQSTTPKRLLVALVFGATQALMALLGYLLGTMIDYMFGDLLRYLAFGLMLLVAARMFVDAMKVLKAKRLYAFTSNWGFLLLGILSAMNTFLMGLCCEGFMPLGNWLFVGVAVAGFVWAWAFISKEYAPKMLRSTSFVEFSGAVFMVLVAILYLFTDLI